MKKADHPELSKTTSKSTKLKKVAIVPKTKPCTNIEFMSKVSKDIIAIKVTEDKTIKQLFSEFYKIMRRYGIKQGTKNPNGVGIIHDNFEWTICSSLFSSHICKTIWFFDLFVSEAPKDLQCY